MEPLQPPPNTHNNLAGGRGASGAAPAHSGHTAGTQPAPPRLQHPQPRLREAGTGTPGTPPPAARGLRRHHPAPGRSPSAPPCPEPAGARGGAAGSRCRAGRGLTSVLQRAREPHGDGADQRLAGAVDDAALAQADLEELHLPHGRAALLCSAGSGACPAEPCRALQSPAEPYRAAPAPPSLPRPGGSALHPPPPGPARAVGRGGRRSREGPGSGGKAGLWGEGGGCPGAILPLPVLPLSSSACNSPCPAVTLPPACSYVPSRLKRPVGVVQTQCGVRAGKQPPHGSKQPPHGSK